MKQLAMMTIALGLMAGVCTTASAAAKTGSTHASPKVTHTTTTSHVSHTSHTGVVPKGTSGPKGRSHH